MLMTVMIHVSNVYMYAFPTVDGSNFLSAVIYNSLSRVCVPLFFMISGMLLIKTPFDKQKYFKRVIKFLSVLVVWSVVYYFARNDFSVKQFGVTLVNSFFNADMTSKHLWFMYAMIGISVALPFIRNMCNNLTRWQENLFIVLWAALSGLDVIYVPLSELVLKAEPKAAYPMPIISAAYYLGYFVCGHILYQRFKSIRLNKNKTVILALGYLVPVAISAAVTYFVSCQKGELFDAMTWYRSIFIIIAAFSLFILIIANEDRFKSRLIPKVSKYSFGIYLIHMLFFYLLKDNFDIIKYNAAITIPLLTIIIYGVSLLACFIISKIPVIKKALI